ncbi:hypothetical protein HaLaN_27709 [Haematococcus lacustris]|uniref:Uncharacterized protein n=1 Tax=Haematococcus lacustris TaxID=44745 RepID=A0A6A0AAJ4_HAELA|nr:hypothetical protein HaLaN_27709 [Haematococcus lacustris]
MPAAMAVEVPDAEQGEQGMLTLWPFGGALCSSHTASSLRARAQHSPASQAQQAQRAKPAPQPGGWVDRDCNAALNMQRIWESRWRPLELCCWPEQGKLPAKGKEYPGRGYKRLQDQPPKAQQQQFAVAQ